MTGTRQLRQDGVMILPSAPSPALSILSQNIRMDTGTTRPGEPDHWGQRAPVLVDLLRTADPDVVGALEVLPSQLPVLEDALASTHLRLGFGREGGGRDEHNLLFLRRERFELLGWDQFWLSEQPELMGSVGWDGHCPRIAVWARVQDRDTGRELLIAVTHLDHAGPLARMNGAALVARRLLEAADGAPVVLMGDFNADSGASPAWEVLREAGFEDARQNAAQIHGEDIGTFPDYGEPTTDGPRIDWIMTRGVAADAYAAHSHDVDGIQASDHAGVMAQLRAL